MLEIVKLGSLYIDGWLQEVGIGYDGGQITFGPTIPGKELQWVKANGLLIADQSICTDISWEQLHNQGLVFGTPVQIDGITYLCRCLKTGAEKGDPNEWNAALNEAGDGNDLWHWESQYFWGQETIPDCVSHRAVRGFRSARHYFNYETTVRYFNIGFRPALEPLGSEPCSPDTLIGKTVRIYGPKGGGLEGRLMDVGDYDLVLDTAASIPTDCSWISKDGDSLVVDRDSVLWLKET